MLDFRGLQYFLYFSIVLTKTLVPIEIMIEKLDKNFEKETAKRQNLGDGVIPVYSPFNANYNYGNSWCFFQCFSEMGWGMVGNIGDTFARGTLTYSCATNDSSRTLFIGNFKNINRCKSYGMQKNKTKTNKQTKQTKKTKNKETNIRIHIHTHTKLD